MTIRKEIINGKVVNTGAGDAYVRSFPDAPEVGQSTVYFFSDEAYQQHNQDVVGASLEEFESIFQNYTPVPATPSVPEAITMRQARLVLLADGLLANVEAAIEALPEPTKTTARIEWEYSNEVQRSNGLISLLSAQLGLNSSEVDDMFVRGSQL